MCWIRHPWGKWEDGQALLFDMWGRRWFQMAQTRRCNRCGKTKVRLIEV